MNILIDGTDFIIKIDQADLPLFSLRHWWLVTSGRCRYMQARKDGKRVYLHREIMKAPSGKVIDHIDGDGLNNERSNLRVVTQRENTWNRSHEVVSLTGDKWHSAMRIGEKRIHTGFFDDEMTARKAKAYIAFMVRGEMARGDVDFSDFDPLLLSASARTLIATYR